MSNETSKPDSPLKVVQSKLILPETNGVPNLAIKRMEREIAAARAKERGVHPQTADQLARELDKLRELADQGLIRALVVVAMTRPSSEMPDRPPKIPISLEANVRVLFACPQTDRAMAVDLASTADAFIEQVMRTKFPPPDKPPDASA